MATRLEHRAILEQDDPPQLVVVLDEYAVRRPIGDPAIMREQLALGHPQFRALLDQLKSGILG